MDGTDPLYTFYRPRNRYLTGPVPTPPTLPPSVEEAYRRKCIQLKQRLNEVEEANDASRVRLVRIQRGIEKMRLERSFLLEQLAKRTSTNVEDSEGSPSPPPTVCLDYLLFSNVLIFTVMLTSPKPKEKPLRTKRGHRKPSFFNELGDGRAGSTFIPQGPVTMSPSSDAFSHTHPEANSLPTAHVRRYPGQTRPTDPSAFSDTKKPRSAFELYSATEKQAMSTTPGQSDDIDKALASGWRELDDSVKEEWQTVYDQRRAEWNREKQSDEKQAAVSKASVAASPDKDVEMGEDGESPAGDVGFNAVNNTKSAS